MIRIYNPQALALLLLAVVVFWFGIRSYAKMSPARKTIVVGLRVVLLLLLVGVLLNVYVWRTDTSRQLCVYYLVDVSSSMQAHREASSQAVVESLEQKSRDSWAGLIVFDSRAALAVPAGPNPDLRKVKDAIVGTGETSVLPRAVSAEEQETNIAEALRLAASSFPSEMAKRVCLVSDFNETAGSSLAEAAAARKAGIDVFSLRPELVFRPDLAVDRVLIPDDVKLERAFTVKVTVTSSVDADRTNGDEVELKLYRNHVQVAGRKLDIRRGTFTESFRQRVDRGGRFLYEARLVTELAQPTENDRAYAYLEVKGLPRVLVVASDPRERRIMRRALDDGRLDVDVRTARGLPETMLDLQGFVSVFVGNVPASDMTSNQMKLLHDYVHELGGVVVWSGGVQALSAGGYAGTIIEDLLPVQCSFTEKETPTSAVVFLVDSSRSIVLHDDDMEGTKQGFMHGLVRSAVESLTDQDRMGVVGFAGTLKSPTWYMGLQKVVDRGRLRQTRITFDGYSHLLQSFTTAHNHLRRVEATNKGIILVTDGFVEPGPEYELLAMQLAADEVTVSCVAVGAAANRELLREIARWGNGRYYAAESAKDAAHVFEREIEEFSRSVIVERPVEALAIAPSEVFRGVETSTAPTLFGYVRVKPKLASEVLMVTERAKDPLLVSWSFGAGNGVAVFSTDTSGKWSQLWVDDWADQFGLLLRNLVAWGMREAPGVEYVPRITVHGWELSFEVDALETDNRFFNGSSPPAGLYALGETGQVFSEAGRIEIHPDLVGPGLFRGRHKVDRRGVYLLKVSRPDGTAVRTTGAVVAINQEAASLLPNRALEGKLCEMTEGRVAANPGDVYQVTGVARKQPRDLSGLLLVLAAVVFALDVLARRWPAVMDRFVSRRETSS